MRLMYTYEVNKEGKSMTLRELVTALNEKDIVTVTDTECSCYANNEPLSEVKESSDELLDSKVTYMGLEYVAKVQITIE